jgi:hypothetical protein
MKNMKIELIILIVLTLTNCSKSQSWEQNVCDCIEENYNIDNWNYFQELNAFEQELIDREKVDTTIKSKLNLLNELSKSKYADFYKYQISERFETFGRESVEYCIRRELFNRDCQERHWSEKLIKQLRYHRQELIGNRDRTQYIQIVANTIAETIENVEGENKLKNLILLQVLYDRIPDETMYKIDQLEIQASLRQKEYDEFDKAKIREIHINKQNRIFINNQEVQTIELCERIKDYLNENMALEVIVDKKANYKGYLDVNNEVKNCIENKRNIDSFNMFKKEYSKLTNTEKEKFQNIYTYKLLRSGSR